MYSAWFILTKNKQRDIFDHCQRIAKKLRSWNNLKRRFRRLFFYWVENKIKLGPWWMLFWNHRMFFSGRAFIGYFLANAFRGIVCFDLLLLKSLYILTKFKILWMFLKFSNFDQPKTDGIFIRFILMFFGMIIKFKYLIFLK